MKSFELNDFSPSDGIGECEEIIIKGGGSISRDFFITLPQIISEEVGAAADYLIDEWDYAMESWRVHLSKIKIIKI